MSEPKEEVAVTANDNVVKELEEEANSTAAAVEEEATAKEEEEVAGSSTKIVDSTSGAEQAESSSGDDDAKGGEEANEAVQEEDTANTTDTGAAEGETIDEGAGAREEEEKEVKETVGNGNIAGENGGKMEEEEEEVEENQESKAPTIKAAPQAAEATPANHDGNEKGQESNTTTDNLSVIRSSTLETEGSFEDCTLTPVDIHKQRQNLRDALANTTKEDNHDDGDDDAGITNGGNRGGSSAIGNEDAHAKFSETNNETYDIREQYQDDTSSASGSAVGIPKPPFHATSALHQDDGTTDGQQASPSPLSKDAKKPSNTKFRKPSIRFTAKKNHSISQSTKASEYASFKKTTSRLKHSILNSLGEFLTSAFADDEETSGSYFSQELLDQLSRSDPSIKGIWLQAKSLNDNHIQQLCESLIRNKVVTEVWLPSNYITDVGAAHIAHMLKFNKCIKELFLGENQIGPKGAAALASALARGNNTLVALGLGDNAIGVEGAGAFAAALRHNHSLYTLDIKGNGIPKASSIRGLLNKMLEFNASDPGDESLVIGLQEELSNLVANLPPDVAEDVVLQAEHALKMAMRCRMMGDKVGAAEAEGLFIRICTTGQKPEDPPEMTVGTMGRKKSGGSSRKQGSSSSGSGSGNKHHGKSKKEKGGKKLKKPTEPDRLDDLNYELSTLKFNATNAKSEADQEKGFDDGMAEMGAKTGDEGVGGNEEGENTEVTVTNVEASVDVPVEAKDDEALKKSGDNDGNDIGNKKEDISQAEE